MRLVDELIKANEQYASAFSHGDLGPPPRRQLAVVGCMDSRMTVEEMLGLKTGDAHIIRNAGGVVTEDVIRSLLISHHLLGTRDFVIINHTECGMLTFQDAELRERLERQSGTAVISPEHFYAFTDPVANVRRQMQKLRAHPWIPREIAIAGLIFDVRTGRLSEVTP
ncbi:MAG TPA: carbonic anhydrase [Candidatus Binataceae bacterium]|nr:carbonic anhydrase [Candidatus Binataceae bacterium]